MVFTQAFLSIAPPVSSFFCNVLDPTVALAQALEMSPILNHVHTFCVTALVSLPHLSRTDPDLLFDGSQTARCLEKCRQSDSGSFCIISVRRWHSRRLPAKSTVTTLSAFTLCLTSYVIAERYSSLSEAFLHASLP